MPDETATPPDAFHTQVLKVAEIGRTQRPGDNFTFYPGETWTWRTLQEQRALTEEQFQRLIQDGVFQPTEADGALPALTGLDLGPLLAEAANPAREED